MTTNIDPAVDDQTDPNGESTVIQELRAKVKELSSNLKDSKSENVDALATARAQVKREGQASQLMSKAGFAGLADIFAAEVDGDLTDESAVKWLEDRKLKASPNASSDEPTADQQLGEVTDLGSQVASASETAPDGNVSKKMDAIADEAKSLDQLTTEFESLLNG